ncbi:hypothetical protein [Dyadobacter frigoris]|uniref:Uncharacterized protein n=1 Tax=Dyadobacter frigoris TaxID=2576211 RepID=A0A4U6CMV9_9BACT|nr:hypothetical protein [Dyadobacter frigoris]TKT85712.1 hypothetical protein FDK13_33295 [Dyadobacter frigoris]
MKKTYSFVIFFLFLFCLTCKKKPNQDVNPDIPADVYVTFSNTFRPYGQYWKNGEMVELATPNVFASARAIFVSDNDIHIVGDASSVSTNIIYSSSIGQYWKNGVVSNVENGIPAKLLYDVAVSEGDVHICGDGLNTKQLKLQAAYWKNGMAVPLDEAAVRDSRARGIFVAGKDVYVAGSLAFQNTTAVYWKNGVVITLGNPLNISYAISVVVSGKDVYVTGSEGIGFHTRARYWKNGVGTFLDNSEFYSEAVDIAVSGKDVYCVGNLQYNDNNRSARLWKNGVSQSLPGALRVSSVFVFNNDVYVAGEGLDNGIKCPMYWKNGVQVLLPNDSNGPFASSIFVKKR